MYVGLYMYTLLYCIVRQYRYDLDHILRPAVYEVVNGEYL